MRRSPQGIASNDYSWPQRQDLEGLPFNTPILAIDLTLLRAATVKAAAQHVRRGILWRPCMAGGSVASVVRVLRAAGANGLTCDDLSDARNALEAGADAVTIMLPPVTGDGPARFAGLAQAAAMTVVCDHFAQAELLASACTQVGTTADVLLRVDVGRQRIGVRPGPDLRDLARGVAGMSGLGLVGACIESQSVASSGVSALTLDERLRVLEQCRLLFERAGHVSPTLSVGDIRDVPAGPLQSAPEVVTEARTSLTGELRRCSAVVAGVIGRPTRDQAIIDVGRRTVGSSFTTAAGVGGDVRVVAVEDGFSVLRLLDSAQDLAIGDLVPVRSNRQPLGNPGRSVLLGEGGRWRIENSSDRLDCREGF